MTRVAITEAWVMPLDFTAVAQCPECKARNLWTCDNAERPAVHYCSCPSCEGIYSMRLTRRWLDLAARQRSHPFTVIRTVAA